jgi:hypothetical protein
MGVAPSAVLSRDGLRGHLALASHPIVVVDVIVDGDGDGDGVSPRAARLVLEKSRPGADRKGRLARISL